MNGPTMAVVAELRRQPATLADLGDRLGYPVRRVLDFIAEARSDGVSIRCVRSPGEVSTFEVHASETLDPLPVMEDNRE